VYRWATTPGFREKTLCSRFGASFHHSDNSNYTNRLLVAQTQQLANA
jgi:hypothetical protein